MRIFHKEARAVAAAGGRRGGGGAAGADRARARRLAAGWRLARAGPGARRRPLPRPRPRAAARGPVAARAPPAARWSTTCTSTWDRPRAPSGGSPARCAAPWPWRPSGPSGWAARRLAGVVTANEDLAARFAAAGARAVSVTNSPWSDAFPEPARHARRAGGALRRRSRAAARPRGHAPAPSRSWTSRAPAWCWPGRATRASCPRAPSHLGVVDHSEVPALLAAGAGGVDPTAAPRQLRSRGADEARGGDGRRTAGGGRATSGRMGAMVRAAGCGLVVPPDDVEAHAAALTRLLARPRRGRAPGRGRAGRLPRRPGLRGPGARADRALRRGAGPVSRDPLRLPVLRERRPAGRRAPLAAHARAGPRRPRGERRDLVRAAQGAHVPERYRGREDGARGGGRPRRVAHLLHPGLRPRPALAGRQLRHLRVVVGGRRRARAAPGRGGGLVPVAARRPPRPPRWPAPAGPASCSRCATSGRTRPSPWAS